MNRVFCTLFDEEYAVKGLTLQRTLANHRPRARLVVFCMDRATERLVEMLRLPNVRAIPLRALEDFSPELRSLRPERSLVEYYWTLTPAACRFVLDREPECESVTYVDADVMMFSDPEPAFGEMGDASVLLIPHRYPPRWQHWEEPGGLYNVQFMVFRNDSRGRAAVDWWHDRCIEWCFDRHEPGRFGDQKYLDDWPQRFAGVHVLRHRGGGLGPWNAGQYEVEQLDRHVTVGGQALLFFHFSSFELLLRRGTVLPLRGLERLSRWTSRVPSFGWTPEPVPLAWRFWSGYSVTASERALVWTRYARELSVTLAEVRAAWPAFSGGSARMSPTQLARLMATTLLPSSWRAHLRGARQLLRPHRADEALMGRVLVTGGLGFIGSHLVERLAGDGHPVTVIDALVPTHGGREAHASRWADAVDVHLMDLVELSEARQVLRGHEVVFNLAGQRSHVDSMVDPLTDLHHNCQAQLAFLEACRAEIPRARVVFASTRQVYGRPLRVPVSEDHPVAPADVNGIHKAAAESYHLLYHSLYGLGAVILRLTNTYGPRMWIADARQGFLGWWINRLLRGEELQVYGDGTQCRDLNHVNDVVDAFVQVGVAGGIEGRVYNLGGSEPMSLSMIAQTLVELFGSGSYRCVPFPTDFAKIDIGGFAADYGRIERELGWSPRVALTDGLRATLKSFTDTAAEPPA